MIIDLNYMHLSDNAEHSLQIRAVIGRGTNYKDWYRKTSNSKKTLHRVWQNILSKFYVFMLPTACLTKNFI